MENLVDFFSCLSNPNDFFAHMPPKSSNRKVADKETLKQHMDLTMYYYEKL